MYCIELEKDRFKFSASHFTIFSESKAERLHGHNYYLSLQFYFDSLNQETGLAAEMNHLKIMLQNICERLDERVLVPSQSKFLKIEQRDSQVEIRFAERFYSFPEGDIVSLPLANISSELLAQYIAGELVVPLQRLGPSMPSKIQVKIQETRGQSVCFEKRLS